MKLNKIVMTLVVVTSSLSTGGPVLYAQEMSSTPPTPKTPELGTDEKVEPRIEPRSQSNALGKNPVSPTVRVIQPREFCQRLTNAMTIMGSQLGSDRRSAVRIGGKASAAIIAQLRSGTMLPYLDVQTFKASTVPETDRKWFSVSEVLVSSLGGNPKNVLLVSDLNDLKLTPQVMPGSQIIVLAKSLGDLSAERAKSLAIQAQALGLEINIIWVNPSREAKDVRAAQGLAFMATLTGGAFLDLGLEGTCGQT